MKKYLLVLFLIVFIVPSVAFASWWNPFTWFQKQPQTEQITPVVSNPDTIPTNVTAPTITPKTVASSVEKVTKTDNQICVDKYGLHSYSTGVKNTNGGLTCQCANNYTWNGKQCIPVQSNGCTSTTGYSPTTGASCNGETPPVSNTPTNPITAQPVKSGYQVCSDAYPNETWDGTITANNKYNCVCQTGYAWNISQASCQLSTNTTNNNTQSSIMNSILHQNDAEINAQKARENSPECQTATNASNAIEQQYTALKNRIDSLPLLSNEAQQLDYQLTTLALQQSSALNKKYSACDGYVPTPLPMTITNCNITGNTANCYSQ